MAKPIEPTPVLRGKDAAAFLKAMRASESRPAPAKSAYLERCRKVFRATRGISH